jgi:hypothetical protein
MRGCPTWVPSATAWGPRALNKVDIIDTSRFQPSVRGVPARAARVGCLSDWIQGTNDWYPAMNRWAIFNRSASRTLEFGHLWLLIPPASDGGLFTLTYTGKAAPHPKSHQLSQLVDHSRSPCPTKISAPVLPSVHRAMGFSRVGLSDPRVTTATAVIHFLAGKIRLL